MPPAFRDSTGCPDLISILLEGRSRLLYRDEEPASEAVGQVALWLQSRRSPFDTIVVETIQESLTPEFIEDLDVAQRRLDEEGLHREAAAVRPFIELFRSMAELRRACQRMQRRYRELQQIAGRGR